MNALLHLSAHELQIACWGTGMAIKKVKSVAKACFEVHTGEKEIRVDFFSAEVLTVGGVSYHTKTKFNFCCCCL